MSLAQDETAQPPIWRHDLMVSLAERLTGEADLHSWAVRVRTVDVAGLNGLQRRELLAMRFLDVADPSADACDR